MSTVFSDIDEAAKRLAEEQKLRKKLKDDAKKKAEYEQKKQTNPLI